MSNEKTAPLKIIFILANLLVLSNFMMFNAVVDRARLTIVGEAISWAIFIGALIGVNAWLYLSYYKVKSE